MTQKMWLILAAVSFAAFMMFKCGGSSRDEIALKIIQAEKGYKDIVILDVDERRLGYNYLIQFTHPDDGKRYETDINVMKSEIERYKRMH